MNQAQSIAEKLRLRLPQIIVVLFIAQPLLDALSFWQDQLQFSNAITLALRFIMLAITLLIGFYLSQRKKAYLTLFAICIILAGTHTLACIHAGKYAAQIGEATVYSLANDLANQLRIYQFPLFTFSFITFMQENPNSFAAVKRSFCYNFLIIAALEIISVITQTNPYTYAGKQLGICGWVVTPSAQSAIISMIVPIVVYLSYRSKHKILFPLTAATGCLLLFFYGTRLTYLAIFAVMLGFLLVLILTRQCTAKVAAILLLCTLICTGCFKLSPMYINQQQHLEILAQRQYDMQQLIEQGIAEYGEDDPHHLEKAYDKYCVGLVERFGIERVAEKFNYSHDGAAVINARAWKTSYCELLLEELPLTSQLFGMELRTLNYNGYNYDAENDFHGIYYLCGLCGLIAMIAFISYFIGLIIWALIKDARKYFTIEAGSFGIALIMGLVHAVLTSGVLRRPNSSFYLSVILAVIYYLVRIKSYEPMCSSEAAARKETTYVE